MDREIRPAPDAALAEKLAALMDAAGVQGAIEIEQYDGKTILCDESNVGGLIADIEVNKIRADTLTLMVAATNALPIILAALSRDARADEWRSIESAPKPSRDGEKIDVWLEPIPERQKYFSNPDHGPGRRLVNAWCTERADYVGYRSDESYNGRELNYRATHWRPLPAPPAAQKKEGT